MESMIAMVVIGVALLSLAQLVGVAIQSDASAEYNTKAMELAQAKIEELKTLYGWQITSAATADALGTGPHGPETVILELPEGTSQGLRTFLVSWEVVDEPGGQKEVTVTVNPPAENPIFKPVSLFARFAP